MLDCSDEPLILLSHPTGNANVRAVLRATERDNLLESFWTTVALPLCLSKSRWIGEEARRNFGRRVFTEIPRRKVRTRPVREAVRMFGNRIGPASLVRHGTGWASIDRVYRDLDMAIATHLRKNPRKIRAVYAYEDGALETFKVAKSAGVKCIYELPIAHWRTLQSILQEESALSPDWVATMEGLKDSHAKRDQKDQELQLADQIVVPSTIVQSSVKSHFGEDVDVAVIPYGAPVFSAHEINTRAADVPLHLMFAGQLRARKGVQYLIAALRRLDVPWRLTLAGSLPAKLPPDLADILHDPRCRWIGHVPHKTLLAELAGAHVFVFPSLVEGLAMVLFEAMASGVPVVATPNSGANDIFVDGREGYIVPIRDPDVIANRLTALFEDEPLRQEMASAALATAKTAGWEVYEERISRIIGEVLSR